MKAKTQIRIGFWGALVFLGLRVEQAIRFWTSSSPEWRKGWLLGTIIFAIYIFGIVRKKLKVCQWIFLGWCIFMSINLLVLFNISVATGKWSGSLENFIETLWTFLFLGVRFGMFTVIFWMGIRGLKQMAVEDRDQKQ